MFYCCFLIFYWRKYEFSAINLLESACFSVVHHRHWVQKPVNAGSLDGITVVSTLYHVFIYFLFCVALTINFFSRILFLYCSYNIWRYTHSVKIFISDCLLSSSVRQKHQHMHSIRFMHPRRPKTSAHSDRLSRLILFIHPWTPQASAHSDQFSRVIRFMHPWTGKRQRVRTSCLVGWLGFNGTFNTE